MKTIYSIALFVLFSFSSVSQDYSISPSTDVWADIQPGGYEILNIDFIHDNSTTDSLELQWELIEKNVPTPAQGWDYSYCDYNVCYLANATGGTMKKFGPNENGYLKITLLAADEGWAFFKFRVFKTGDEANADTLTYTYHSLLGLSDIDLGQKVNIYPNPVTSNKINIQNVLPESTITIVNSVGQTVATSVSNDVNVVFESISIDEGIYFIHLSRKNNIYATRKILVR